jgi:hypothetical protein
MNRLSLSKANRIRAMAIRHFTLGHVDERLFLGTSQVARIYRHAMTTLSDAEAAAAARFGTAAPGGKLNLKDPVQGVSQ